MQKTETKITLTCDRCSKVVDYLGQLYLKTPTMFGTLGLVTGHRETVADLCPECWDQFMDFISRERQWWRRLMKWEPYVEETNEQIQ